MTLPVGFEKFPGGAFVGYQLNRARALGYTEPEELRRAAATVRSRSQCVEVFDALSRRAEAEGRLRNATSYLRIAEFFTLDWFLGMNAEHLGSDRVTQDVPVLCGEHDAFQPPVLARAQVRALASARSVAVRTFTKAEHAAQHGQMGNLDLACRVVTDWLRDPTAPVAVPG